MSDVVERAERLIREAGWDKGHIVVGLVVELKAERAANQRINRVLDALENRIKVERLRSRDRAAVDGELARLHRESK